MLAEARDEAIQEGSAAKIASLDTGLVDVAVAACQLMLQAGHTERGIACIQALLEFACLTNVYAAPGEIHLTHLQDHLLCEHASTRQKAGAAVYLIWFVEIDVN